MFPDSTLTRRLVGTYTRPDGTSFRGSIRFVLTATGIDRTPDALVHYPAIDVVCQLDYQGKFAVQLLCTDDFDLEPENVVYHVYEQFSGGRSYYIWLPYGPGTEIDIMSLAPPAPPTSIPDDGSAITQAQADARYVNVEGDIVEGPLTLLYDPQDDRVAVHRKYVDDKFYDASAVALQNYVRRDGSNPMVGSLDSGTYPLIHVGEPLAPDDSSTKNYTDTGDAALKDYADTADAALKDWATDAIANAHEVEIGTTAPTAPGVLLWINPTEAP